MLWSNTSAIRSVVIVSENGQMRFQAQGDLGDVRHDVGVRLGGVFSDATGRVGADWVEVTQRHDVPALQQTCEMAHLIVGTCNEFVYLFGTANVHKHFLDHVLRAPVYVGDVSDRAVFRDWKFLRVAVDSARARKHQLVAFVRFHYLVDNKKNICCIKNTRPAD